MSRDRQSRGKVHELIGVRGRVGSADDRVVARELLGRAL